MVADALIAGISERLCSTAKVRPEPIERGAINWHDLEGELFNSLVISSTVTGGNDDNEGVCREEMTGRWAVAVDERILELELESTLI